MKKIKKIIALLSISTLSIAGVISVVGCEKTSTTNEKDKGTPASPETPVTPTPPTSPTSPTTPKRPEIKTELDRILEAEIRRPDTLPPELTKEQYIYDPTNNYYASLNGLSGQKLAEELIKLQKENAQKQTHRYQDLPSFYGMAFRDKYYDNDNSIIDLFSETHGQDPYTYPNYTSGVSSSKTEGGGTNREHIIPQSWFGRNETPRADAHFVWPGDIYVNGKRGNFFYDEVKGNVEESFKNGSKLGKNSKNETVYEPNDIVKGDIGRAHLYFAFTYPSYVNSTNGNSFFKKESPYLPERFINLYVKWHRTDTVDQFNIDLNNIVSNFEKGLRNPFIDYPDLVQNLFSSTPKPFVNKGVLISYKPK